MHEHCPTGCRCFTRQDRKEDPVHESVKHHAHLDHRETVFVNAHGLEYRAQLLRYEDIGCETCADLAIYGSGGVLIGSITGAVFSSEDRKWHSPPPKTEKQLKSEELADLRLRLAQRVPPRDFEREALEKMIAALTIGEE